jgi:hypothetical protein
MYDMSLKIPSYPSLFINYAIELHESIVDTGCKH